MRKNFKVNIPNMALLLALLLPVPPTQQKRFHSLMGPFQVVLRRVTACPPEMLATVHINYTLHDARTNRRQMPTFSGKITSPFLVNDSFDSRLALAVWSNMGGWKDNAHVFNFKEFCKTLNLMAPDPWSSLQSSIFGEVLGCPLYPGYYFYDNFTMDVTENQKKVPIKYFIYGRWRGDAMVLYKTGEVAGCMRAYVDTLPI